LGHLNIGSVKMLQEKSMVEGMEVVKGSTPSPQCEACICAKQHTRPFPKEAKSTYRKVGDITFSDLWGPAQVTGINGEVYYISFTDGHS
ncbi:hypothetical protein C8J56DRAFT_721865, partial [Mycena floridula]